MSIFVVFHTPPPLLFTVEKRKEIIKNVPVARFKNNAFYVSKNVFDIFRSIHNPPILINGMVPNKRGGAGKITKRISGCNRSFGTGGY